MAVALLAAACVRSTPPVAPTVVVVDGVGAAAVLTSFTEPPASGPSWQPKDEVEVEWQGSWWPAVIVEKRGARWLVHYEGYTDDWDEVVGGERIRERQVEPPMDEAADDEDEPDP